MRSLFLFVLVLFLSACAKDPVMTDDAPVTPEDYYSTFSSIKWEEIGRSVEDRVIMKTEFGDGDDVTLFFSCFHGNESSTPRFGFEFAQLLHDHPELVQSGKRVVLIPMLNPDGFAADTRTNANGTDLNRNYPTQNWGQQPENRRRPIRFGDSPASEPETQIVLQLLDEIQPDKIISVHQPLACNNPDGPAGLGLAKLMGKYNGYELQEYIGFPTPGSFGTYAGKELVIPMVTLELPPGEPYSEEFDQMWSDNKEALLAVVNCNLDELPE